MGLSDEIKIPLKCPECGHEFQEALARLKNDPVIACPSCGKGFRVKSGGTAQDAAEKVDELDRALGKLFKS
jgi:DNA-directed RNA polymerase subunit RPC12/RpoP